MGVVTTVGSGVGNPLPLMCVGGGGFVTMTDD
jgi:hypothetical protein